MKIKKSEMIILERNNLNNDKYAQEKSETGHFQTGNIYKIIILARSNLKKDNPKKGDSEKELKKDNSVKGKSEKPRLWTRQLLKSNYEKDKSEN